MPRPDPNVLDLRRLVLEQREAEEQKKHHRAPSWKISRPSRTRPTPLHRPRIVRRNWTMFRRELLKFMVVISIVCVIGGFATFANAALNATKTTTTDARSGITALQSGFSAMGGGNGAAAVTAFHLASKQFDQAAKELNDGLPVTLRNLPVINPKYDAARRLLADAKRIADAGATLSATLPETTPVHAAVQITNDGIIQGSVGVLTTLLQQRDVFAQSLSQTVAAVSDIAAIPAKDVPSSMRPQFIELQRLYSGLVGDKATLDNLTNFLLNLFAPEKSQEYLVVFQNNDEIRATGGFTGTFLLVQFEKGTFKVLDAPGNGPFALSDVIAKGNLPPQPILSIAPYWTFHDANWFLDVPTSAKAMIEFYKQDRGFAPDGVMYLTPSVMEDLLRVTGPIRPEKYGVDITAENFVQATEQQVQFKYDKALNNPKQFLIDLVPMMLTKLSQLSSPDALRALALTLKHGTQNDLLFYSSVAAQQKNIVGLGWDGSIDTSKSDYLAVVDTNLGGGKTDRSIEEQIDANVVVDGPVVRHTVTVKRKHNGTTGDILTGTTNRDFLRVYTPANAQLVSIVGATVPKSDWFQTPTTGATAPLLLQQGEGQVLVDSANGIRVTHESGKTVFGSWSQIAPGEEQTIVVTYTTPISADKEWKLIWQHQPGAVPVRKWNLTYTDRSRDIISASPVARSSNKHKVSFASDSLISREFSVQYK